MAKHDQMPKYHELMNPLLKALHELGGSGSIEEILSEVSDSLDLPEDVLTVPHNPDKSSRTETRVPSRMGSHISKEIWDNR